MLDSLIMWALSSSVSPRRIWEYSFKAEKSRLYQFGRLSNPSMGYDYDADYHIFGISQEIPNPWLLRYHRKMGKAVVEAAALKNTEDSLEFILYIKDRYYDLLLVNGKIDVENKRLKALDSLIRIVNRGVRVGKFPMAHLDALKARREHLIGRISLLKEKYRGMLLGLSVLTGRNLPDIDDTLPNPPAIPEEDSMLSLLDNSPLLKFKSTEIRLASARVGYESARVFPGIEVSAGLYRYRDIPLGGITAGVSVPIPIFNNNRGNLGAAKYSLEMVKADSAFIHGRLAEEILLLTRNYKAFIEKLRRTYEVEIPALLRAYSTTLNAYMKGAVGYTEVFSALDALYETRIEILEIKRNAFATLNRIESILNVDFGR